METSFLLSSSDVMRRHRNSGSYKLAGNKQEFPARRHAKAHFSTSTSRGRVTDFICEADRDEVPLLLLEVVEALKGISSASGANPPLCARPESNR